MKYKNKRGLTGMDLVFTLILIVGFGIASIVIYNLFTEVNTDLQLEPEDDLSNSSKAIVQDLVDRTPATLDGAFLMILVLMWAFLIISAFMIDTHPVFFIISIVILIGVFIASALISNAYEELTSDAELSAAAANFPITNWIINHLLIVIISIGLSVVLVLYAKSRAG